MNKALLSVLEKITPEEQRILAGSPTVERDLYTSGKDFVVDSAKMLAKGKLIDIRTHTRFVEFPNHKHNYVELSYMCRGRTTHVINDETTLRLEEGDLLFLNRHAFHRILPAGMEDICVNFIILPPFFDAALDRMGQNVLSEFLLSSLRDRPGEHDILHFKASDLLPVQNLVENLVYSMLNPAENRREINQETMSLLFLQLLNHTDRVEPVARTQDDYFVSAARRYVQSHYREGTLTELAAQLNQSVSALSKAIKKGTGKTFSELLLDRRMERAEQLLCHSDLTVTEVILAVGYENTSYFHRAFRERYGESPKQYRRKIRTQNQ